MEEILRFTKMDFCQPILLPPDKRIQEILLNNIWHLSGSISTPVTNFHHSHALISNFLVFSSQSYCHYCSPRDHMISFFRPVVSYVGSLVFWFYLFHISVWSIPLHLNCRAIFFSMVYFLLIYEMEKHHMMSYYFSSLYKSHFFASIFPTYPKHG